jgi:hypothetical protein
MESLLGYVLMDHISQLPIQIHEDKSLTHMCPA